MNRAVTAFTSLILVCVAATQLWAQAPVDPVFPLKGRLSRDAPFDESALWGHEDHTQPPRAPFSAVWAKYNVYLERCVRNTRKDFARHMSDAVNESPTDELKSVFQFCLWRHFARHKPERLRDILKESQGQNHPMSTELTFQLAMTDVRRKKSAAARQGLEKIPAGTRRYPQAQLQLATLDVKRNRKQAFRRLLTLPKATLSRKDRRRAHLLTIDLAWELKRPLLGRILLGEQLERSPKSRRDLKMRRWMKKARMPDPLTRVDDVLRTTKGRKRTRALDRLARSWRKRREGTAAVAFAYGRIYDRRRDRGRALGRYDRALKLTKDPRVLYRVHKARLGAAFQLGHYEDVLKSRDTMLSILENACNGLCQTPALLLGQDVWFKVARSHTMLKQDKESERFFASLEPHIMDTGPHARMLFEMGLQAYYAKRYDDARARMLRLLKEHEHRSGAGRTPWGARATRWLSHIASLHGDQETSQRLQEALARKWPLHSSAKHTPWIPKSQQTDWRATSTPLPTPNKVNEEVYFLARAGLLTDAVPALQDLMKRGKAEPLAVASLAHSALSIGKPWIAQNALDRCSGCLGSTGTIPRALLNQSFALRYKQEIRDAAEEAGVSPALAAAIIKHESGFDPTRVSRAGAIGLMQIMPKTARFFAKKNLPNLTAPHRKLRDPIINLKIGTRLLAQLLRRYQGDELKALIAYNAGSGRFARS